MAYDYSSTLAILLCGFRWDEKISSYNDAFALKCNGMRHCYDISFGYDKVQSVRLSIFVNAKNLEGCGEMRDK